jgi:hypothetical protein
MRIHVLAIAVLGSLAAGCADHGGSSARIASAITDSSHRSSFSAASRMAVPVAHRRIGSLPDRGNLIQYDRASTVRDGGSYRAYPVQISEAHALRAIGQGGMVVASPDGHPIRLQYVGRVEHANGNWTWIGRPAGSPAGTEAVLTFGEKAVFGTIPASDGPLQVSTQGGRTWIVQADPRAAAMEPVPRESDVLAPLGRNRGPQSLVRNGLVASAAAPVRAAAAGASSSPTVDVVVGYTNGFAARLGGQSQAITRLQYLVDLGNQAYADSQVTGRIRMVGTVQVSFADNTSNQSTLFQLSGLSCTTDANGALRTPDTGQSCTPVAAPDALKPLINARNRLGADLVTLVRNFTSPDNGSCGVGWLLGAGQTTITRADAPYGVSIVSDSGGNAFPSQSTTCREEYLVHELGHNMGLQHDRATAAGTDDTNGDANLLDPEEFGVFPYSFGLSTDSSGGNFFTIMSLRRTGQTGYRVFSNPNITVCGGLPCGVADREDNARALNQTMAIVASFRTSALGGAWLSGDFNGDGLSDVLWRNLSTGGNVVWRSAIASMQLALPPVTDQAWQVAGVADFDGDGKGDILWRNGSTGGDVIWKSANAQTKVLLPTVALSWSVAGVGDFNGDGKGDILWRSTTTGANVLWLSGNPQTQQALTPVADQSWTPMGAGDFDADGKDDILWRNTITGGNVVWRSANAQTKLVLTTVADLNWSVAGVGDFDADGHSDILWRNQATGANVVWRSANAQTKLVLTTVPDLNWNIEAVGDYNGDGHADIVWRNAATGANVIWRSANPQTKQGMTTVADLSWTIVG